MKTLGVLSQKGGAGKTTLAIHLAVLANAVLIDTDPQASAADWGRARENDTPVVVESTIEGLASTLEAARTADSAWAIVDTAGKAAADIIEVAKLADLVVIPCRAAILDLRAVGPTVRIIQATGRRAVFVLNATPASRGDSDVSLVRDAREALKGYGLPVAPVALTQRAALSHALSSGHAVTEFDPTGKAAAELRDLWAFLEGELSHA